MAVLADPAADRHRRVHYHRCCALDRAIAALVEAERTLGGDGLLRAVRAGLEGIWDSLASIELAETAHRG